LEKIRRNYNSTYSIFNPVKIESYIEEFKIPTWGDQVKILGVAPQMRNYYSDIQLFFYSILQ
jgi:hypothetical protein